MSEQPDPSGSRSVKSPARTRDHGEYAALNGQLQIVARASTRDAATTTAIARGEPAPVVVHAPVAAARRVED